MLSLVLVTIIFLLQHHTSFHAHYHEYQSTSSFICQTRSTSQQHKQKIIQSFPRSGIPRSASFPARVLFQTSLSLVSPYCCHLYQADTQFRKPILNGGKDFLIHKWLITLLQMVIGCFRPYVFYCHNQMHMLYLQRVRLLSDSVLQH